MQAARGVLDNRASRALIRETIWGYNNGSNESAAQRRSGKDISMWCDNPNHTYASVIDMHFYGFCLRVNMTGDVRTVSSRRS
eukprot:3752117-Lingulodinium_polyedra.AAC.1